MSEKGLKGIKLNSARLVDTLYWNLTRQYILLFDVLCIGLGQTGQRGGAEGVAAVRGAGRGGLGELGAGESSGSSGRGSAQPGEAALASAAPGRRTEAGLGPADPALPRVPEPQVGSTLPKIYPQLLKTSNTVLNLNLWP